MNMNLAQPKTIKAVIHAYSEHHFNDYYYYLGPLIFNFLCEGNILSNKYELNVAQNVFFFSIKTKFHIHRTVFLSHQVVAAQN